LLVGPAEVCAERLAGLVAAGARRIFVWPLRDDAAQLALFRERVTPLVPGDRSRSAGFQHPAAPSVVPGGSAQSGDGGVGDVGRS
jgi:hypothetical protein